MVDDPGTCLDPNGNGDPSTPGTTFTPPGEESSGCNSGPSGGLNGLALGFMLGMLYVWRRFRREDYGL
jgi:hypothetical protein